MSWFVYVLKSETDGRFYKGMTKNISNRLVEHNKGKMKSTKGFRPWKLVYSEECASRIAAREKEIYLKSGAGREFIKTLS